MGTVVFEPPTFNLTTKNLTTEPPGPSGRIARALALCAGDQEFDSKPSQTNNLKIDTSHFLARHSALIGKGKDWLAQDQDNVTE